MYLDTTVEAIRQSDVNRLKSELVAMVNDTSPVEIHIDVYAGSAVLRAAIVGTQRSATQSAAKTIVERFQERDFTPTLASFPILTISDAEGYW